MTSSLLAALLVLAAIGVVVMALRARRHRRERDARDREVRRLEAILDEREGEIRRLEEALEEAGQVQERFFDLVTHELRSPLSAILGYQELLEDGVYGGLDENTAEPVERIGRSARHLVHLVDGLVELSQLQAGTVRPDLEPLDLGVLMSSVADAFRTHAEERSLVPAVHLPPSLPTIRTDRARLIRAFDLLITSAVKHPGDDTLTLDVQARPDGADTRITGTAIRYHDDSDDPASRLGIRLAVACAIARALHGDLRLDIDDGSTVRGLEFAITSVPENGQQRPPSTAAD